MVLRGVFVFCIREDGGGGGGGGYVENEDPGQFL